MDTKIVYKMKPYMSILYTKYAYKIDTFVHIFAILVYKSSGKPHQIDVKNMSIFLKFFTYFTQTFVKTM